jgi:chemotaxis protein CheD
VNPFAPPGSEFPPPLRGFEGVNRYWDGILGKWVAQVLPGEYYVTQQDEVIATVLGSCVSTCVRDPYSGVGGMNHYMLPTGRVAEPGEALRYGAYAVDRLLNDLVRYGAAFERLEVKVFGGGRVIKTASDVGQQNVEFAHQYFLRAGLVVMVEDTRGTWARRVRYFPATGKALVQRFETRDPREAALEGTSPEGPEITTSVTRLRSATTTFDNGGGARDDTRPGSRRFGLGAEATNGGHLSRPGVQRRRGGP